MLDHAFLAAIGATRRSLGLLQRHTVEERLHVDVLLGDVSWETSYTLPGEEQPPRVQADLTFDWPTWSQTAYRGWTVGEGFDEPPEIDFEVVLRVQRLARRPALDKLMPLLPEQGPEVGGLPLERTLPLVQEQQLRDAGSEWAVEVSYNGLVPLDEEVLGDEAALDRLLAPLGSWLASTLVRLTDLELAFLPATGEDR